MFLPLKEKVRLLLIEQGHLSLVHPVRVDHDAAFPLLAENVRKPHRGDHPALQNVPQDIPHAHRRQLVRVPHQDQPCPRLQRPQQPPH